MTIRALIARALDALADGDVDLAVAALREAELLLEREIAAA